MPQNLSDTVAAHVRAEMARKQVAQDALADALGLSQASVSRRLRGVTPFELDDLDVVADLLGVAVADLFMKDAA